MGNEQLTARVRAHRLAVVTEPPPAPSDYADAFAIARDPADPRPAERWARDGFGRLPAVARRSGMLAHRWILGFDLGPWVSPDHIFGWRIATSEPDLLHLEAHSAMFSGHMVWRLDDTRLTMSTFLRYGRRTAPALWAVVGNIHRGSTPALLWLAATAFRPDAAAAGA